MRKIVTFLWFNDQHRKVDFYVSLFDDAKIVNKSYLTESVAKEMEKNTGDLSTIDFELNGQNFTALNGGPMYSFSEAISIQVNCKTQEEVAIFWDSLSEGGEPIACGWLKDRFGVSCNCPGGPGHYDAIRIPLKLIGLPPLCLVC